MGVLAILCHQDLNVFPNNSLWVAEILHYMSMWGEEQWRISPKATQANCSAWELESLYKCWNHSITAAAGKLSSLRIGITLLYQSFEIVPPLPLQIHYGWSEPTSVNGVKYASVASLFNTAEPKLSLSCTCQFYLKNKSVHSHPPRSEVLLLRSFRIPDSWNECGGSAIWRRPRQLDSIITW